MSTLPRMTISLTAPQQAWLQVEAARLGISIADVIRRIVDEKRAAATEGNR